MFRVTHLGNRKTSDKEEPNEEGKERWAQGGGGIRSSEPLDMATLVSQYPGLSPSWCQPVLQRLFALTGQCVAFQDNTPDQTHPTPSSGQVLSFFLLTGLYCPRSEHQSRQLEWLVERGAKLSHMGQAGQEMCTHE